MKKQTFLSKEQLSAVFDSFSTNQVVSVARIRYKNRKEIRTHENVRVEQLRAFIESCSTEGHQPGGDLELEIPVLGQTLVGHHDGVYWLEKSKQATELTDSRGDAQQAVQPDRREDAAPG
jgi:hypothetical protein